MKETSIAKVAARFMCDRKIKKMYHFELHMAGEELRKQDVNLHLDRDRWRDFEYEWHNVFVSNEHGIILLKDHDYLLREVLHSEHIIGIKFDSSEWDRRLAEEYDRRKDRVPKDCGAEETVKDLESCLSETERELKNLQSVIKKYRANIAAVRAMMAQR